MNRFVFFDSDLVFDAAAWESAYNQTHQHLMLGNIHANSTNEEIYRAVFGEEMSTRALARMQRRAAGALRSYTTGSQIRFNATANADAPEVWICSSYGDERCAMLHTPLLSFKYNTIII